MSKIKEKFIKDKAHCNIGTIGHVDHGKTTLTAAITKALSMSGTNTKFTKYADIDKHVEERRRGITISATHIEYETKIRHYTHIDCPGHQNYIKNMITGAAQMDGAILVIALTEGPQEQTREHVILAKQVGISYLIIYGNKLDAVLEKDSIDVVELLSLELIASYGYSSDSPFIKGSARKALEESIPSDIGTNSILTLMNAVDNFIPQPDRAYDAPFLLAIEEIYSISGRGTVVTGKIEKGKISINSEVELIGSKIFKTICTGLEMYNKSLEIALAGDSVGALIRGISKKDVKRGFVLSEPGIIKPYIAFVAKAYFLSYEEGGRKKPIVSNYMPQFFFRTASITGAIILDETHDKIFPGDTVEFKVKLVEKAPLFDGLHFLMREGTLTLGAGVMLKVGTESTIADFIINN
jgi:elongation factor Tu